MKAKITVILLLFSLVGSGQYFNPYTRAYEEKFGDLKIQYSPFKPLHYDRDLRFEYKENQSNEVLVYNDYIQQLIFKDAYYSLVDNTWQITNQISDTANLLVYTNCYKGDGSMYINISGLLTTDSIAVDSHNLDLPTCAINGRLDIANGDTVSYTTIYRNDTIWAQYSFTEGFDSVVYDISGNNIHGSIVNNDNSNWIIANGYPYELFDTNGLLLLNSKYNSTFDNDSLCRWVDRTGNLQTFSFTENPGFLTIESNGNGVDNCFATLRDVKYNQRDYYIEASVTNFSENPTTFYIGANIGYSSGRITITLGAGEDTIIIGTVKGRTSDTDIGIGWLAAQNDTTYKLKIDYYNFYFVNYDQSTLVNANGLSTYKRSLYFKQQNELHKTDWQNLYYSMGLNEKNLVQYENINTGNIPVSFTYTGADTNNIDTLNYYKLDFDRIEYFSSQNNGRDVFWFAPFFDTTNAAGTSLHYCSGVDYDETGKRLFISRFHYNPTSSKNLTSQIYIYDQFFNRTIIDITDSIDFIQGLTYNYDDDLLYVCGQTPVNEDLGNPRSILVYDMSTDSIKEVWHDTLISITQAGSIAYREDSIYYKPVFTSFYKMDLTSGQWVDTIAVAVGGEGINIDPSNNFWIYNGSGDGIYKFTLSGIQVDTYAKPSILNEESEGIAYFRDNLLWIGTDKQTGDYSNIIVLVDIDQ